MGFRASRFRSLALAVLAVISFSTLLGVTSAQAQWLKAESRNFIVYSDGNERALREYVQDLETFDWVLRVWTGRPVEEAAARRLPIYLLNGRSDMRQVFPTISDTVAGVYVPSTEDVFAVALRGEEDDYVFHEYAHHFFLQNFSGVTFPSWLSEGLAEYYMTVEIRPGSIQLGSHNPWRASSLFQGPWPPLEDLLSKRMGQIRRADHQANYYSVAWLLTHWFLSDETRRPWLDVYLADVRSGGDPAEAMERATGQNLNQLTQTLRTYARGGIRFSRIDNIAPQVEITVTRLPRSADDLLLLGQRIKIGVAEDQIDNTLAMVRRAAARHPGDPLALLVLGHAELHMGDPVEGERLLMHLLEIEPQNVEALQFMASARMMQAEERPDDARVLLNQARGFLARAYAVDPDNYLTLYHNAKSREGAATYPNDNDLETWIQAFTLAPQLPAVRLGFAAALIQADQREAAIALLTPLANAPHGGDAADIALALIETARSGGEAPPPEALEAPVEPDMPPLGPGEEPASPDTPTP